jgi:IMP cyclohydrolase
MYLGRIVAVGKTRNGELVGMYRVSSRSFPSRRTQHIDRETIAIVPKEGHESDISRNPYIAYNCLRIMGDFAVLGNGTHVDPIADKLETGMNARDSIVSVLFGIDYEHDHLKTPRIVTVIDKEGRECLLGIIREDALLVKKMQLNSGEAFYIATYENNYPSKKFKDNNFNVANAEEACEYIMGKGVFEEMEKPVLAVSVFEEKKGYALATAEDWTK